MPALVAGSATHVGLVRAQNEDSFLAGRRVWAVADGMGGYAAGEIASALAIEAMAELDADPAVLTGASVLAAVDGANERILAHATEHAATRGMGTTLAGVALVAEDGEDRLCVFNVGDSRVYRFVHGHLGQVTRDHSEVADMVERGLLTPNQAKRHPLRNVITRCLGMAHPPGADTWLARVKPGDTFVVCSDGLTGEVADRVIADVLVKVSQPQAAAEELVAAALASGAHDNVTVVVLAVGE